MATTLTEKKCQPCEGIGHPLKAAKTGELIKKIPGWQLSVDRKMISREFIMKNFMSSVNFINQVAIIAESENHHPDIQLTGYRKLRIELSTHAVGGLSENDFILAAKINDLPVELKK